MAPPEIRTEYQTIEVIRQVYVPVPAKLTAPVPLAELPDNGGFRTVDTLQLGAAYRTQTVRINQCNEKLSAIAALGNEEP